MARKSRKNINVQKPAESNSGSISQNQQVTEVVSEDALATAAYIRLSVENNGHETDNSLKTQIELVESFIRENGNLHLIDTYIDNGFSGTKFDRPECILRRPTDMGAFTDGQCAFLPDRQNDIIPRCS